MNGERLHEWCSGGRVGGASSRYDRTPVTGMTPSYGGRTPMYGSQTPLYDGSRTPHYGLSLIHISEPTRPY